MAGFFGLFGGKTKYVDETNESSGESPESKESFYLNADESKTFGNIEFMRKPNTIKRSFAKVGNGEGKKSVKSVSSLKVSTITDGGLTPTSPSENSNGSLGESSPKSERRTGDNNLDTFRKMARDIKK